MLTFYFFGHIVEQHLGTKRFVYFYLIAIVFASFAYSLCTILSVFLKFGWSVYSNAIEEGIDLYNAYSMLGASGAIMAVLVVASRIKPNTIVLIYFLFPIKLKNLIYVLIGIDLLSVINQNNNHIAVTAHLGGALFGFIYYYCYNRISFHSPNIKSYQHWKEQFKKNPQSFTQQPQENNVFSIYSQQYSQPNIQNELSQPDIQENKRPEKKQYPPEVIDALLDKIRRYGIASLTQEEREILQQISNNYSNR
jgi:membrane associated rhomboid family serine protease